MNFSKLAQKLYTGVRKYRSGEVKKFLSPRKILPARVFTNKVIFISNLSRDVFIKKLLRVIFAKINKLINFSKRFEPRRISVTIVTPVEPRILTTTRREGPSTRFEDISKAVISSVVRGFVTVIVAGFCDFEISVLSIPSKMTVVCGQLDSQYCVGLSSVMEIKN